MKGCGTMSGGRNGQGGIALVLVLWVVALMTVIALSVSSLSRTEVQLARNRVDEARIRALADAATAYAVLRLSATEEEDLWLPDGKPYAWHFAGNDLQVIIFNESSRVDLNRSSEQVLEKLIRATGVETAAVEGLVAALLDWRDADDSSRPLGAEDADYRAEGLHYGSWRGAFNDVAVLGQVLGLTPELSQQLLPYLTVDSLESQVMLEYADPFVRGALSEDESGVPIQPGERRRDDSDPVDQGEEHEDRGGGRSNRGGPVYRIRAALADGGPAMETLVRRGGRTSGMMVLWRRLNWQGNTPSPADEK